MCYRNFSEEVHSLTNCVKSASEIFLHEPIQFSGNIINVLLLKLVSLHMYSIFSEVLHTCEKNIQISSVRTFRFLISVLHHQRVKEECSIWGYARVKIKTVVLWVMTPYSLSCHQQHFRGTCYPVSAGQKRIPCCRWRQQVSPRWQQSFTRCQNPDDQNTIYRRGSATYLM